jgi:uncharacterized protein YlxP (DUF503 family)
MKYNKHGNGNGLDDLYCLPETKQESERLIAFLKEINHSYQISFSNVEGQDWYRKAFIEIPFGESLKDQIIDAMKEAIH